ncbi:Hypothetical predicted protein [Mytilus galloprovincialis]|uniref:Uncharacterized protein n=1 Tax=Mytilus galloprovincialis TaxID=29158 RepID=A0A8B6ET93_MYTGA|nr:Hypothetical predicted protein [Mytilus galloprovincialis]
MSSKENVLTTDAVVCRTEKPKVRFVDSLPDVRSNFVTLVNALEERFAPTSQTELYRVQFRERKQKAAETLPEMGQAVRRLSNLTYPTAPHEAIRLAIELEAFNQAESSNRVNRGHLRSTNQSENIDSTDIISRAHTGAMEKNGDVNENNGENADIKAEGILGLDFLTANKVVLAVVSERLFIGESEVQVIFEGTLGCYRVVSSEIVGITPSSEVVLNGKVCFPGGYNLNSFEGDIEPSENSAKNDGPWIARTLEKVNECVPVRLLNMKQGCVSGFNNWTSR